MKKIPRIFLSLFICAGCLVCAGCGGEPAEDVNPSSADPAGYVFNAKGTDIRINADMGTISEKLGEPLSYFEDPSCAAEGTAKIYTYPGFVITTVPDGDTDRVNLIELKDDTVSTAEGADLSSTRDDIIRIYGDGFEETDGQIAFEKGGMRLCFIFRDGLLASIQYRAAG